MELDYKDFSERLFGLVAQLLRSHDRLVLPYFGAFLGSYCPAQLLFGSNQIAPAKKTLLFDSQITENDNLFINAFALQEQLNHETAETLVHQWVEFISTELLEKRTLEFPPIGLLFFNSEAKLELKQSDYNLLPQSDGLPVLPALPILRDKSNLTPPPPPPPMESKPKKQPSSPAKIAAFSVLGIGLLIGGFFGVKALVSNQQNGQIATIDTVKIDSATLSNPDNNSNDSLLIADSSQQPSPEPQPEPIPEPQPEPQPEPKPEPQPNPNNQPQAGAKDYVIIVGAFSDPKNAKRMRRRLEKEGYFIDIATTYAGYERIGVQISCLPAELKEHLREIRRKFSPKAWVLKE